VACYQVLELGKTWATNNRQLIIRDRCIIDNRDMLSWYHFNNSVLFEEVQHGLYVIFCRLDWWWSCIFCPEPGKKIRVPKGSANHPESKL